MAVPGAPIYTRDQLVYNLDCQLNDWLNRSSRGCSGTIVIVSPFTVIPFVDHQGVKFLQRKFSNFPNNQIRLIFYARDPPDQLWSNEFFKIGAKSCILQHVDCKPKKSGGWTPKNPAHYFHHKLIAFCPDSGDQLVEIVFTSANFTTYHYNFEKYLSHNLSGMEALQKMEKTSEVDQIGLLFIGLTVSQNRDSWLSPDKPVSKDAWNSFVNGMKSICTAAVSPVQQQQLLQQYQQAMRESSSGSYPGNLPSFHSQVASPPMVTATMSTPLLGAVGGGIQQGQAQSLQGAYVYTRDELFQGLDNKLNNWFSQAVGEVLIVSPFFQSKFSPGDFRYNCYNAQYLKRKLEEIRRGNQVSLTICTNDEPLDGKTLLANYRACNFHWQTSKSFHVKLLAFCPGEGSNHPVEIVYTSANFDNTHYMFDNNRAYVNRDWWLEFYLPRKDFYSIRQIFTEQLCDRRHPINM